LGQGRTEPCHPVATEIKKHSFDTPLRQNGVCCLRFDVTIIINADGQNFMSWENCNAKGLWQISQWYLF